jgi:FkbM family methyltransferase
MRQLARLGLRHAPPLLLATAAKLTAPRAELRLCPGWSYSAAGDITGLRAGLRRALWTTFRDRDIHRPVTVRWYDGLRVRLFLGNDLSYCVYLGGSFEPNEFVFLDRILRPGMVFVDAGANDGLYSLFAAHRVGPSGRVLAVEPSSREYARLLANVRLNALGNVTVVRAALGAAPSNATLAIASDWHGGQNTIGPRVSNPNVETTSHEHVAVQTLDRLAAVHEIDRVDVVKLDVEGSEIRAIAGGRTIIERHRPTLLLEVESERLESQGNTKEELFVALAALGYCIQVFDLRTGQLCRPQNPGQVKGNVVAAPSEVRLPAL